MINYRLRCASGHAFDGWFKNAAAYDAQAEGGALRCPVCDGTKVEKAIMAPAVARRDKGLARHEPSPPPPQPVPAPPPRMPAQMPAMPPEAARMFAVARALRTHVERNFENVGKRFAGETRAMHLGEKDHRPIWGQASGEEVKDLLDEGIEVAPLPDVPKLDD